MMRFSKRRWGFLKKLADGNSQRIGDAPQGFGAGLDAPVFDPREIRGRDTRLPADLLLRQLLFVADLYHSAPDAQFCPSRRAFPLGMLT